MRVYVFAAMLYRLLYQPCAQGKSKDVLRRRLYSDLLFNGHALRYLVAGVARFGKSRYTAKLIFQESIMPLRLACSTICFRAAPIEVVLEEIHRFGFETLDLAVIPGFCPHFDAARQNGAEREDFVALIRQSGFRVPTVTAVPGNFNAPDADFQLLVQAGRANLKLAALLGAEGLNVNCGLPIADRSDFRAHATREAKGLKRIAQDAAEMGLRLNVEAPHRNGLCRTLDEAQWLLEAIDEANAHFLLDVTHVQAGGATPADAVQRLAGRIGHVHLRDGKGEDIFFVPGDGTIDFRAFFQALERSGYEGYCAFELEGVGETISERRASLKRAIQFTLSQTSAVMGLRTVALL
jgi:sugar phosphate isomerase/epimerase